jgi:ubiquinone/menaquinone biosynthesis C-methylase UbiE
MFLSRRVTQAEYFDSERPSAEVAEFFKSLGRVNRLFDFTEPFRRLVPQLVSPGCRAITILDVGAGDGALGRTVQGWAANRGWDWRITNLDTSLAALSLNPHDLNVVGSAVRLPLQNASFDVVIASQMAHHLNEGEVTALLAEAWRVTRQALIVCDLHRNLGLYLLLWLLFCFQKHSPSFKADALLSVKRAWRVRDLARLAKQAGINAAQVNLYFGARIILQARKAGNPASRRRRCQVPSAKHQPRPRDKARHGPS